MIGLRRKGQPVFVLMTVLALLIAIPHPSALAALIPTDVANDVVQGREARERIMRFMAREDVRAALVAQGIDPDEADARVVTLTDAEIAQLVQKLGVVKQTANAYAAAGIASWDGTHVYALDAATGKIRWQNNTSGRLAGPSPSCRLDWRGGDVTTVATVPHRPSHIVGSAP